MKLRVWVICSFFLIFSGINAIAIDSMTTIYGSKLSGMKPEEITRIKNSKVDLIHIQLVLGRTSSSSIKKLKEIASGKKLLLQFWWGPKGRYNWSYHSLPGIAYEPEVRKDFFAEIDRIISKLDKKNIYGVFLLEECGFFGVDIDVPGDWEKNKYYISDGNEDGNPYNNHTPQNPAWDSDKPNVRRYNSLFKKETGLDMAMAPIWNREKRFVFHRWCERTAARAEIEFFKHIRGKFSGIKTFTWYAPGHPNYVKSDFSLYKGWLDGAIANPYNSANFNYQWYRRYKTLFPDLILGVIIYGNYLKRDIKIRRLTNAYLGGADIVGFFEGTTRKYFGVERDSDIGFAHFHPRQQHRDKDESMDWESPGIWKVNTELFSKMKPVKAFNKRAPVLLVSANWDCNYQASGHHYSCLSFVDAIPSGSAHMVDLDKYSMIIAHQCPFSNHKDFIRSYGMPGPGLDIEKVKKYLNKGGILVIVNNESPDFLSDFIVSQGKIKVKKLIWQKKELLLSRKNLVFKGKGLKPFFEGCLIKFGKGFIWYTGFLDGSERLFKMPEYINYEKYMANALRTLMSGAGKERLGDKFIALPESSCNYRQADDGEFGGTCQFYLQYVKPSIFKLKGIDIFTGNTNPELNYMQTGIIVKKKLGKL